MGPLICVCLVFTVFLVIGTVKLSKLCARLDRHAEKNEAMRDQFVRSLHSQSAVRVFMTEADPALDTTVFARYASVNHTSKQFGDICIAVSKIVEALKRARIPLDHTLSYGVYDEDYTGLRAGEDLLDEDIEALQERTMEYLRANPNSIVDAVLVRVAVDEADAEQARDVVRGIIEQANNDRRILDAQG